MLYRVLFFSVAPLLAISCASPMEMNLEEPSVDPVEIGKGELTGAGAEGIEAATLVIRTAAEWQALLARIDTVNPESKTFSEVDIDFADFQILAVFDAVRSSGGYGVEIVSVVPDGDQLVVSVKRTSPTGVAVNIFTQPFHIVKIKRTDREIVFE